MTRATFRCSDLWVLGSGVVHRWNGATWSRLFVDGSTRKLWPVGDGHAYALVTRGSGSSHPTFLLARIGGARTVYLPVGEGTRAITGWGNDVYVLTKRSCCATATTRPTFSAVVSSGCGGLPHPLLLRRLGIVEPTYGEPRCGDTAVLFLLLPPSVKRAERELATGRHRVRRAT